MIAERNRARPLWARAGAISLFAIIAVLVSLHARAHPLAHPQRDELRLSSARIELVIDEEIAPGAPAQSLRLLFDRDRNGHLDDAEQAALLEHLARSAGLHARLSVDGAQVALARVPGSLRGERLADDPSSTALLAARIVLSAPWPAGSGDWRGRRKIEFTDDAPDDTGHVPVQIFCSACAIVDSSSGAYAHDPRGDWVLGAEVSPKSPLEVRVKL